MNNTTALSTTNGNGADALAIESALIEGDLSKLTATQRTMYYRSVCESLGLNHLTQPFAYIKLSGKLTLYARKDCTDQIRTKRGVSVQIVGRETIGDVYVVTSRATDRSGRVDESTGAVPIKGLSGENLANAYMKAETKSKRRVTLSIVGLGWIEESEVASIVEAEHVTVDYATGEIVQPTRHDEPKRIDPPKETAPAKPALPPRPWSAEDAAAGIMKAAEVFARKMGEGESTPEDHKKLGIACTNLGLGHDVRAKLIRYVFDAESAKDLAACEIAAVIHWVAAAKDETGAYVPNLDSVEEARRIIAAHDAEIGSVIGDGLDAMGQPIDDSVASMAAETTAGGVE
jgi:hypothetical protein